VIPWPLLLGPLAKAGSWLIGSKTGRIVLAVTAGALCLWLYGQVREADGRREERARVERQDATAAENGHAARNRARNGDVSDSLRNRSF
jgi:hypothetical protein